MRSDADIPATALPQVLQDVAEMCGVGVAVAIARAFGGQDMWLPQEPGLKHPLAQLVGLKAAATICARFGGGSMNWPSAVHYLRWWDAQRLRRDGRTPREIAKALGISARQVRRLTPGIAGAVGDGDHGGEVGRRPCPVCGHRPRPAKDPAEDPRQPDLFAQSSAA